MSATRSSTAAPAEDEQRVWHDEAFELLSNHRRRFTLHYLRRHGREAELGELAEHIAAWENETSVSDVSSAERKRVYTSLQQVHLPRLDESGVIEFDERAGAVTLGPRAENLDLYMEVVDDRDVPWSQYYLLLGVSNGAILAAGYAGIPPLSWIPNIAFGIFILTTFLVSALIHTHYSRTEMRLGASETPPEVER